MRRLLLLPLLALAACSSNNSASTGDDAGGDATTSTDASDAATDPLGPGPAPVAAGISPACSGTLATDGSALKYTDKTVDWELDDSHLGLRGNHIEAVDFDGDGYPDLLVHMGTQDRSDPSLPGPKQLVRVLMNRPKSGGGRHFVDATVDSNYGAIRDTATPGAGKLRTTQLAVAGDIDNDGKPDVVVGTYLDPTKPELDVGDRNDALLNDGTGKFKLVPKSDLQVVPSSPILPTTSYALIDFDRDGILDLWVGFWYAAYGVSENGVQARLFKGNGDGTFVDVTPKSGLETQTGMTASYRAGTNHRPAYGVTACDLDDDGAPELLVSAYGRQWNLLYKNGTPAGGGAKFQEIGRASGFGGDDNLTYTDNQFYLCYCQASGKCTGPAPLISCSSSSWTPGVDDQPWRLNGNTFTTVCADLNADAMLDLYSAEIKHWHIGQSSDPSELLVNSGATSAAPIHFSRPGRGPTGLEWAHPTSDWNEGGIMVAAADLDLDGLLDIVVGASDYPGNYSLVFHQKPGAPGTFEEIGQAIGLHHVCANGVAIADFDRDGDLDVVVGSSTARDCATTWTKGNEVHFYENALNDGANKRGFLQVRLQGTGKGGANVSGIGARVKLLSGGKVLRQDVSGGYGHFGQQHDLALTFGLGGSCNVDELEVRWPDATNSVQRFSGIGAGRRVLVKQGGAISDDPAKP